MTNNSQLYEEVSLQDAQEDQQHWQRTATAPTDSHQIQALPSVSNPSKVQLAWNKLMEHANLLVEDTDAF